VAYVRRKRLKGRDYYYLVESYRQDGKVKTRHLKYLGTTPHVPPQYQHLLESHRGRVQRLLWDPVRLGAVIARRVRTGPVA